MSYRGGAAGLSWDGDGGGRGRFTRRATSNNLRRLIESTSVTSQQRDEDPQRRAECCRDRSNTSCEGRAETNR